MPWLRNEGHGIFFIRMAHHPLSRRDVLLEVGTQDVAVAQLLVDDAVAGQWAVDLLDVAQTLTAGLIHHRERQRHQQD